MATTERPDSLPDLIGQTELKQNLMLMLGAAQRRGEAPRHVLLSGPAGLGKTSVARLVAAHLGVKLHVTTGTVLRDDADVARLLGSVDVERGDVVLIDEMHSMGKKALVALLTAMEDNTVSVRGKRNAKPTEVRLAPFTLVGATTEPGKLPRPILDRFGFRGAMQFYTDDELTEVLVRYAKCIGLVAERDATARLARAGRGTPRVAIDLLNDASDLALMEGDGRVTDTIAAASLARKHIDHLGLDEQDRDVLRAVAVEYAGGPVGVVRIAALLGLDQQTVSNVVEPFLVRRKLLALSGSGRVAKPAAYEHLGIRQPAFLPAA